MRPHRDRRRFLFLAAFRFEKKYLFPHCQFISHYLAIELPDSGRHLMLRDHLSFKRMADESEQKKVETRVGGVFGWESVVPMGSYFSILSGWCARGRCRVR